MTRLCPKCGIELTPETAHKRTLGANGLQSVCKRDSNARRAEAKAEARVRVQASGCMSHESIGNALGISRVRVQQIEAKALKRLRAMAEELR